MTDGNRQVFYMHGYTIVFTNHHTNIVNSTTGFLIDILLHSHYCTSFHVKFMLGIGIPVYTTSVLSVLEGWTDLIIRWQFGLWIATFWSHCDTGRWSNMVGSQR